MIWKLLVAVAIGWMGWRMWHGWGRPLPGTPRPAPPPPASSALTGPDADARAILGVGPEAGPEEIRAAHRRLIATVHPDRGGSPELTRQVNAARDTLLRKSGG